VLTLFIVKLILLFYISAGVYNFKLIILLSAAFHRVSWWWQIIIWIFISCYFFYTLFQ